MVKKYVALPLVLTKNNSMKKIAVLCFLFVSSQIICAQNPEEVIEEVMIEEISEEQEVMDVPFAIIEEVPIFPGCSGTKQEKKNCLNRSIQKHVAENFNLKKMGTLELSPGKKKIYIQFLIDKNGETKKVLARGPHEEAEKEGIRVVKSLPKMIAGKHRGRTVGVRYMLPISFNIL